MSFLTDETYVGGLLDLQLSLPNYLCTDTDTPAGVIETRMGHPKIVT